MKTVLPHASPQLWPTERHTAHHQPGRRGEEEIAKRARAEAAGWGLSANSQRDPGLQGKAVLLAPGAPWEDVRSAVGGPGTFATLSSYPATSPLPVGEHFLCSESL